MRPGTDPRRAVLATGPERWPLLATFAAARRHAGARRVVAAWLVLVAASVLLGLATARRGWSGVPLSVGPLSFEVPVHPWLPLDLATALLLGPMWGILPAALTSWTRTVFSGMPLLPAAVQSLADPLAILLLWGGMSFARADPTLRRRGSIAHFLLYGTVASVAGSVGAHVGIAGHGLEFTAGQAIWEAWVVSALAHVLVGAGPLLYLAGPTVRSLLHRELPASPAVGLGAAGGLGLLLLTLGSLLLSAAIVLVGFFHTLGARGLVPEAAQRELTLFLAVFVATSLAATAALSHGIARHAREQERLSRLDPLTGCLNRRALGSVAYREVHRAHRLGTPLAALMVDLDGFKAINDRHGHAAGDVVLAEVAARLRGAIRDTDELFRWGGDEFLVLAPHTTRSDALRLADRLREAVAVQPIPVGTALEVRLSVSVGVVAAHPHELDIDRLVAAADQELYRAKAARV